MHTRAVIHAYYCALAPLLWSRGSSAGVNRKPFPGHRILARPADAGERLRGGDGGGRGGGGGGGGGHLQFT